MNTINENGSQRIQGVQEKKSESEDKVVSSILKYVGIGIMLLVLLIPMYLILNLVEGRADLMDDVEDEIAISYAESQRINGLYWRFDVITQPKSAARSQLTQTKQINAYELNYDAEVDVTILKRAIYEVPVYNSNIDVDGYFIVTENMLDAINHRVAFEITDYQGLSNVPKIIIGDKEYIFNLKDGYLVADVKLPEGVKVGSKLTFKMNLLMKGINSLSILPTGNVTNINVASAYPSPAFKGDFLPNTREVTDNGFKASWNVLAISAVGTLKGAVVEFVNPANPYQQVTRTAKYGILIIIMVFVAGLLVEFITKRSINLVQYAIIACSLLLFYALLLAFTEIIGFGLSYILAALMTISALTLYFRGILKNKAANVLGIFLILVYCVNYMLLGMVTYALLAGSLVMFILLSVVMYMTTNLNKVNK